MHDLIERADLGRPVTFKLAVVILADLARNGARRLHHVADGAGLHGVGSQLIDHDVSPSFLFCTPVKSERSPDERSDIRASITLVPGCRFAHPGYDAGFSCS